MYHWTIRKSTMAKLGHVAETKAPERRHVCMSHHQGLTLDVSKPWERSLLRYLQESKASNRVSNLSTPPPELMLLKHTESRDCALEIIQHSNNNMDDSISLHSTTSLPATRRSSSIYRPTGATSLMDQDETTFSSSSFKIGRTANFGSLSTISAMRTQDDDADDMPIDDEARCEKDEGRELYTKKRGIHILKARSIHDSVYADRDDIMDADATCATTDLGHFFCAWGTSSPMELVSFANLRGPLTGAIPEHENEQ